MINHVEGLDDNIKSYYEYAFGHLLKDKALVLSDIILIFKNDINKFKYFVVNSEQKGDLNYSNEKEILTENLLEFLTSFMKNFAELSLLLEDLTKDVDVLLKDKSL